MPVAAQAGHASRRLHCFAVLGRRRHVELACNSFRSWQVSASVSSGDSSQVARDSPNTKMLTTAAWGVCKELAKTSEKGEELLVLGIEDARRSSRSPGCSMFSPSTRLAACLCLCRFAECTSATSDSSHEGRSGGRRPLLPSRVRTGVQQASEGA